MSCLLVKCHGNRTDRISQNCRLGSSTLIFKFFSDAALGKSFILKWSKRRAQKIIHFIVSSCMQCSNLLHAKVTSNSKMNKWGNQKNYKPIMHFLLEPCRKNTLILINDRNTSCGCLDLAQLCCGRSGDGAATAPACKGLANGQVALSCCLPSLPTLTSHLKSCVCPKESRWSWSWFQEDLSCFDLFCVAKQVLG